MSGTSEKRLLTELRDKDYRDAFVESHIRTGAAYQIRALRTARNWSQEELGKRANMTQSVVARLENPDYGKFSLSTLIKLASAFDVALLVRFVSFGELLHRTVDLSPEALDVSSFQMDREVSASADMDRWLTSTIATPRVSPVVLSFDTLSQNIERSQPFWQEAYKWHRPTAAESVKKASAFRVRGHKWRLSVNAPTSSYESTDSSIAEPVAETLQ